MHINSQLDKTPFGGINGEKAGECGWGVGEMSAKTRVWLLLVLGLLLAACGGGGGGGSGNTPPPSQNPSPPPSGGTPPPEQEPPPSEEEPPPSEEEPPPSEEEPPPGGSTEPSSAEIVFPWRSSGAMGSTIIVRGTASDPDGVASVTVNGIPAVLTSLAEPAVSSSKPASTLQALSPFSASAASEPQNEEAADEVEWSVEIELEPGDNPLVVAVEDSTGEVTEDVDTAETSYVEVPVTFTLDGERTRVVGLSWTLTPAGRVQRLVEHDYELSQQTLHPVLNANPALTCFRAAAADFYYVVLAEAETWELHRFNVDTQETSSSDIPPDVLAPGEGFDPDPRMRRLVCNDASDNAYLLANYRASEGDGFGSAGFAKSRIVELSLSSGAAAVLTESEESPPWLAMDITMAGDGLVSLADLNDVAPLTYIGSDGMREPLAPGVTVGGMALAAVLEEQRVYVATFAGIEEVRIDDEEKDDIAPAEPTEPLLFSQVTSIAVDLTNDRIIVGDSGLDALIAVDMATGERSEFLARKVGEGPLFIAPRAFAVTADESLAYLVDDGGNRPERLFEVDLSNGNRHVIGDIQQENSAPITGLALDEDGQRVFVARQDIVLEVNLESEGVQVIASSGSNLLTGIRALAYDAAHERLLVGDSDQAIVEIDLVTWNQDVVSRADSQGDGPPFAGIASITLGAEGTLAYVANQETNQVIRVDLDSGDREVIALECLEGAQPATLAQVLFDEGTGELIVLADGLFVVDIDTLVCTPVPSVPARVSPLHVQVTPKGRMLAAVFNALGQLDRESGDVVIVSK
jgi:hypothetical protein